MLGEDGIPSDFPWNECRMLYSNPNGFAVKFLHGKCDQDYHFLVRSAYIDAKCIISEWIKLTANPSDERVAKIFQQETDFAFLSHIFQRASMLPGEQYYLLISIAYLSQCLELNGFVLTERFIALHNQIHNKKVDSIDIHALDSSWLDLAELLVDSLDEIRPKVESNLPPGALISATVTATAELVSKSSQKRIRAEEEPPSHGVSSRKRRTRTSTTHADFEYDMSTIIRSGSNTSNPNLSNGQTNGTSGGVKPGGGFVPTVTLEAGNSSSLLLVEKDGKESSPYFVIPKGFSGMLHAYQGLEFTDEGVVDHVKPAPASKRPLPYRSMIISNISELVTSRSSSYGNLVHVPNAKLPAKKQSTEMPDVKLENRIRKRRSNAASSYFNLLLNGGQQGVGGVGVVTDSPTKQPQSDPSNDNGTELADAEEDADAGEKPSYMNITYNHSSSYYQPHGHKQQQQQQQPVTNAYNLSQLQPDDMLEGIGKDAGVARRQKKNKKMFHLLLLDVDNWQGHYAGVCSAAAAQGKSTKLAVSPYFNHAAPALKSDKSTPHSNKLENVPILEISEPISIKGVVSLASQRFRIQLNAFQNEKKKFSRNCNDLHEALWIFEVTLLISDGPKSLEGQLKIGNYFPFCHLGNRFFVYSNPLEYFMELARQVTGFLHRAEVFPEDLIHLAVSYLDQMIMGPKELMSEEELQLSEDILATYHPQFMHLWTPVIRCFREKDRMVKDVLEEVSNGEIHSILDLLSDPNTPPLMRIPKLMMQPLTDIGDPTGGSAGSNIFGGTIYSVGNMLYYSNTQATNAPPIRLTNNYGGSDDEAPTDGQTAGEMTVNAMNVVEGNEDNEKQVVSSDTNVLVTKLLKEKRQNRASKMTPQSGPDYDAKHGPSMSIPDDSISIIPVAPKQKRSYARFNKHKIAREGLQNPTSTIESNSFLRPLTDLFGNKPPNAAIYPSLKFPVVLNQANSNATIGGAGSLLTQTNLNGGFPQQDGNNELNLDRANLIPLAAPKSIPSQSIATASVNLSSTTTTCDAMPSQDLLAIEQKQLMDLIEAHSFDPNNDQSSSTSISSQGSEDERAANALAQILTKSSASRS